MSTWKIPETAEQLVPTRELATCIKRVVRRQAQVCELDFGHIEKHACIRRRLGVWSISGRIAIIGSYSGYQDPV